MNQTLNPILNNVFIAPCLNSVLYRCSSSEAQITPWTFYDFGIIPDLRELNGIKQVRIEMIGKYTVASR